MTTPPKNPTGFDAFFQTISSSPEFRTAIEHDRSGDEFVILEKSLKDIESQTQKINEIPSPMDKEPGKTDSIESKKTNPPNTGESPIVQVEHFIMKDPVTWGFAGIAGMTDLKKELEESFIRPLKLKFRIEKMRSEKIVPINQESTALSTEESKKNALLERVYQEYEKFKISIPTGMLFYGPPGTGKTFITKKLAEELGCGFISKNMGEFGSSYLHQTTKNIRDFFDGAKKASEHEPIILFLDEIDSLVSKRTANVDANKAEEVSQFLQEFNALEESPNLIVIAVTNRPDHLDSAILRSGRLDKKIYLGPPDETARKELFRMYIEKIGRPHAELDYDKLATWTIGYVSADIKTICDEAARDSSRELLAIMDELDSDKSNDKEIGDHSITMELLQETIRETPSSLKMTDMSVYEDWIEKIK